MLDQNFLITKLSTMSLNKWKTFLQIDNTRFKTIRLVIFNCVPYYTTQYYNIVVDRETFINIVITIIYNKEVVSKRLLSSFSLLGTSIFNSLIRKSQVNITISINVGLSLRSIVEILTNRL